MTTIAWVGVAGAILYALHRLGLWMEARGWIYYRDKRASGGAMGSAFLELQSMLEPGARHVLEIRQNEKAEDTESGDPPEAAAKPGSDQ